MTTMIVRDVMTAKVQTVTPTTTVRQIAKILVDGGFSGVPVVDDDGLPVGMVTESDLIALATTAERDVGREWWLTHLAEGEPLSPEFIAYLDQTERTARDVMAAPVVTVAETTELPEVARLFISYKIKRLPVLREGKMVGIVSRADLVRRIANEPARQQPATHRGGILSDMVAALEERFTQPDPAPSSAPAAKVEEPRKPVTADTFNALVDEFGHKKAEQHDEEKQVAAEARKALVKQMTEHHINDEEWQEILRRARVAAEAGQKELLLLRFPCDLCSDGGRAINAPLPEWPETLRGEAAEIYLHWERELKPNGFRLTAQVIDFPGGIPGDIGLTLAWAGGEAPAASSD
jgi:CBS domain-containing protein